MHSNPNDDMQERISRNHDESRAAWEGESVGAIPVWFRSINVSVRLIRYSNRKKSVKSFLFLIKTEVDRFAKVH